MPDHCRLRFAHTVYVNNMHNFHWSATSFFPKWLRFFFAGTDFIVYTEVRRTERQPVQQHPLKEHLFCLFLYRWWREEAGLKAGLQSAPSTLGVRNLCMRQEPQDGSIHNAPLCSSWEPFLACFFFTEAEFSSSLGVIVDLAEIFVNLWPVSVALPYHATLSQFR